MLLLSSFVRLPPTPVTTTTTLSALIRRRTVATTATSLASSLLQDFQSELTAAGIEWTANPYELDRHGRGEAFHAVRPPALVTFPTCTQAVQDIVQRCAQRRWPMIPFGAGTCVEGQLGVVESSTSNKEYRPTISIDMSRMNQILHLPGDNTANNCDTMPPDPYVIVQAGVTRQQLDVALRATGFQFTVDPGAAHATIGGMVSTGAAGTTTVRYGAMRDNLLGLQAVLAMDDDNKNNNNNTTAATLVQTGCTTRKNAAGYDLTSLLCGAEGTLGVVTQATLRVWPVPACCAAGRLSFTTLTAAARAVAELLAVGVDVVRCELLDAASVRAFCTVQKQQQQHQTDDEEGTLEEVPTLFLELQGPTETILQEQMDMVNELIGSYPETRHVKWATAVADRQALWKARHSLYYAAIASRPEATSALVTDACVNLSHLPALLEATAADVQTAGLVGPCFGHAGDGSFHCILPVSAETDSDEYWERVQWVNDNLLQRTLAVGGTVTGEHGIGTGKRKYLERQYGPGAIQMMRAIKRALDPHGLFNPGKVLELEVEK
eukprot:scaffold34919_cov155-Amphora_coffeaeformis.AAC.3